MTALGLCTGHYVTLLFDMEKIWTYLFSDKPIYVHLNCEAKQLIDIEDCEWSGIAKAAYLMAEAKGVIQKYFNKHPNKTSFHFYIRNKDIRLYRVIDILSH